MIVGANITISLRKILIIKAVWSVCGSWFIFVGVFIGLHAVGYAQCPKVESFLVDACGKERQDEFLVINTGANGFSISDLQLDFDSNNNNFGPLNNDIHINHGNSPSFPEPCSFVAGDVSLIGGCASVIAVLDGDYVPPYSLLVVQLGNTASHVYDFSGLCGDGECIYVTKNSCDRASGVFSNYGVGERTLVVSWVNGNGCTQVCTYDRAKLDDQDGAYFAPALAGNEQYGNAGCAVTPVVDWPLAATAFAGNDTTICVKASMVVSLNGDIGGSAISAMWSGGLGDFNNVYLLGAEYYPSDEEISQGKVSLTLTTNMVGNGECPLGQSTVEIGFDSLLSDIQLVKEFDGYGLACSGDSNGVIQAQVYDGVAPYDYLWSHGENKSINSGLGAGAYRVTVVDSDGCLGGAAIELVAPERIELQMASFPEGCNGALGKVMIDGIDGGVPPFDLLLDTYQIALQNAPYTYQKELASGWHQLVVMDKNHCLDTVDLLIEEGYEFDVDLGPDMLIPQGEEVTVALNYDNTVSLEKISWTVDSLLDCFNCESITLNPLFSERIRVDVTDEQGCSTSDEMQIFVQQPGIYIPNIFSPNGDGINDYLSIYPSGQVATIEYFVLYDRYGNEILHFSGEEARSPMNIWDGQYHGKMMSSQVLIYYIRVRFRDDRSEEFYGSITLVH